MHSTIYLFGGIQVIYFVQIKQNNHIRQTKKDSGNDSKLNVKIV